MSMRPADINLPPTFSISIPLVPDARDNTEYAVGERSIGHPSHTRSAIDEHEDGRSIFGLLSQD